MESSVLGIHHVTAITADAQANIDFYAGALGLRLVKVTVNFDDPASYHLYYGDELGHPGSIMTFFAWPGAAPGRIGPPQVGVTSFSVPAGSLEYWSQRLDSLGTLACEPTERFGEMVLPFADPDGLELELVGVLDDPRPPWANSPVPARHAIRGFYGVTLAEEGYQRTAALLTGRLGFSPVKDQDARFRYQVGAGGPGAIVDLLCIPDSPPGRMGSGTVHHVAWQTPDDARQAAWRDRLAAAGLNVTPVRDRVYFRSIYFREPGGVLFEIATDSPGFTVDETPEQLGSHLRLPPWLERARQQISRALPRLDLPAVRQGVVP